MFGNSCNCPTCGCSCAGGSYLGGTIIVYQSATVTEPPYVPKLARLSNSLAERRARFSREAAQRWADWLREAPALPGPRPPPPRKRIRCCAASSRHMVG